MENYNYNLEFNNLYLIIIFIAYTLIYSTNPYIVSITSFIYSLNYTSIFVISSIILTYLIILFVKFEINVSFTIKFR
jgi:hypothetical protein